MATAELFQMDNKRDANKQKALDSALAQIERQFGKGSIMKLGADSPVQQIEGDLDRFDRTRYRAGHWRFAQGPHHRDLRPRKLGQDDADAALRGRGTKEGRGPAPLSMPNMRSIHNMRKSWALTSTSF